MCGSKIDKKWRFCNRCGRLLNNEVEIINNFDNVSSSHNNKEKNWNSNYNTENFIIIVEICIALTLSVILIDIWLKLSHKLILFHCVIYVCINKKVEI